jgi:hypothetical protein
MRQGQQNKRMRGRGRKGPNPLTRSYESNGPDVKIRGTALHIAEKYMTLARDAQSSGDRVAAESYLQHAEHYYRIVAAAQAQMPQQQQQQPHSNPRGDEDSDDETDDRQGRGNGQGGQPAFGLSDPQPYLNGNGQDRSQSGDEAADAAEGGRERREGDQAQGSGHRGRRRRPYRDRQDRGEDGGQTKEPVAAAPEPPAEAAAGDD